MRLLDSVVSLHHDNHVNVTMSQRRKLMKPTIRIDGEVFRYLQGKARPLEDSPNDVLRREFGLDGATQVARLKANGGGNGKNSADREVSVHKSGNSYAFYIPRDWAKRMGVQSNCKMLVRFDGATLVARRRQ
jgi:hypothetical protein